MPPLDWASDDEEDNDVLYVKLLEISVDRFLSLLGLEKTTLVFLKE